MPYVKISDPNIIDLAAWNQLINVVNQHSDSINSITNNFGTTGTGSIDWNADNAYAAREFTAGSEKIVYGRIKIIQEIRYSTEMLTLATMFLEQPHLAQDQLLLAQFSLVMLVFLL